MELQFVTTDEQVADVLTKPFVRGKFEGFRKMLGIMDDVSLAERECSCLQLRETSFVPSRLVQDGQ